MKPCSYLFRSKHIRQPKRLKSNRGGMDKKEEEEVEEEAEKEEEEEEEVKEKEKKPPMLNFQLQ